MDEDSTSARVETSTLEATIELADEDGPVRGVLRTEDGPPRKFFGWLELMDALEQVRADAGR